MTPEDAKNFHDTLTEAAVGARIDRAQMDLLGDDYLDPKLWELLRRRLQTVYRRVTGEPDAVLTIKLGGETDDA